MTLAYFDQFPGWSRGDRALPDVLRHQIVHDVPGWSEFIRQECQRYSQRYVDMAADFQTRLVEAEWMLTTGV